MAQLQRGHLRALIIDGGPTRAETQQLLAEAGFQVRERGRARPSSPPRARGARPSPLPIIAQRRWRP